MPGIAGSRYSEQRTGLREISAKRVLGVDAQLDGVPALRELLLRPWQRLAGGDPDLRRNEIDADDLLGDRMLDLQPRVHLEEVERRPIAGALEEELDRPGVAIAGGARDRNRGVAHALPQRRRQRRWTASPR